MSSGIMEYEGVQDQLDGSIHWEIISNTSIKSSPPPLPLQQQNQGEPEQFEELIATSSMETEVNADNIFGYEDDADSLKLDFYFDFNNEAFLHSFFMTVLFFISCLIIFTSSMYFIQYSQDLFLLFAYHDRIQNDLHAVSNSRPLFESAGQRAGKALDIAFEYLISCCSKNMPFVEFGNPGSFQKWTSYGGAIFKKILKQVTFGNLGSFQMYGGSFFKKMLTKSWWLRVWGEKIYDRCSELRWYGWLPAPVDALVYRICSYWNPPVPIRVSSNYHSFLSRFADLFHQLIAKII